MQKLVEFLCQVNLEITLIFWQQNYRITPFLVPPTKLTLKKKAKLVGGTISNRVIISKNKKGRFHGFSLGTNLRNIIFLNFFSEFAT